MKYFLLGRSGLRVSQLCLGTMTFGTDWGWGADKTGSRAMIDQFVDAGGNFIDTANRYTNGTSESFLGELLHGQREQVVLATKYTLATDDHDLNAAGNQRKNLVQSLDASLRRLKTDYIDLLWVHARDTLTPVEEIMRALDDQVRLGKVLYVGVSDWPAWEAAQATTLASLRGWSPFIGLQVEYNLLERTVERELLPMADGLGLGVTAWSPLARGLLTGKYLSDSTAQGRAAQQGHTEKLDQRQIAIIQTVVSIAQEIGCSGAQVALAWLLSRKTPTIPIIGASRPKQLADNLGATEIELTKDQLDRLNRASSIDLGFPGAFLQTDYIREMVYGKRYTEIDWRSGGTKRPPADLE